MLEDKLQENWSPCKWTTQSGEEVKGEVVNGAKNLYGTINEVKKPIHFCGPSPFDNSAIAEEEEKKELPDTSQPDQHPVTDQDDPNGAAQQRPYEETKGPEHPQTVHQRADSDQATLQTFESILAQQLK